MPEYKHYPHRPPALTPAFVQSEFARVLELLPCYRHEGGRAPLLENHRVARITIFWYYLAISVHVLAIVATETSRRLQVTDVVWMSLPVSLHLRKKVALIDALNLFDRAVD